jgi:hypothetical protein
VQSAFPDTGQVGVGSEEVVPLKSPRILLAAGDGVDQTAFGAIWFYFERELGIPIVPINLRDLDGGSLNDYSVLIIPSGSAGRRLGLGTAPPGSRPGAGGGAVIGVGGAVGLLGRKELVSRRSRSSPRFHRREETPRSPMRRPAAAAFTFRAGWKQARVHPGAIFRQQS